jgi:hypothetical protein
MPDKSEVEIAEIFARLKEEVRNRPASDRPQSSTGSGAERPFEHRPTRRGRVRGYLFVPVKRVLRKLMRWYVEPVAAHQRTFNLSVLNLVDELSERTEADVGRLERRLEALEQRLAPDQDKPSA